MIQELPASSLVLDKPQVIGIDQDIEGEVKSRYMLVCDWSVKPQQSQFHLDSKYQIL